MFGIILRQACLSNIASMSEKDSAGLVIGGFLHLNYEGVKECMQRGVLGAEVVPVRVL